MSNSTSVLPRYKDPITQKSYIKTNVDPITHFTMGLMSKKESTDSSLTPRTVIAQKNLPSSPSSI